MFRDFSLKCTEENYSGYRRSQLSLPVCLQAAEWTEEELSLLSRLMVKFPGGAPGRWEKIAQELGRCVTDVKVFKICFDQPPRLRVLVVQ